MIRPSPSLVAPIRGGTIRTLSVSLLAVLAMVAGLILSRSRHPANSPVQEVEADSDDADGMLSLEALRQAGI